MLVITVVISVGVIPYLRFLICAQVSAISLTGQQFYRCMYVSISSLLPTPEIGSNPRTAEIAFVNLGVCQSWSDRTTTSPVTVSSVSNSKSVTLVTRHIWSFSKKVVSGPTRSFSGTRARWVGLAIGKTLSQRKFKSNLRHKYSSSTPALRL